MSTFVCPVVTITIEPHNNADALEIANIDGMTYQAIVGKGQFQTGDKVVYIPEQAIVPDSIISELNLDGKLAGSKKNRVKAIRLRGVFSQGLIYPKHGDNPIGTDMSETLGIVKYEPPIPTNMAGEVCNVGREYTINFDVENISNYPDVFSDSEIVDVTEKIHGTFMMIGAYKNDEGLHHDEIFNDGKVFVSSKGLGGKGLVFKNNEKNDNNLYVRAMKQNNLNDIAHNIVNDFFKRHTDIEGIIMMGEVFGKGVQDLSYGADTSNDENIGFRLFHIVMVAKGDHQKHYMSPLDTRRIAEDYGLMCPTLLYRGPFDMDIIKQETSGKETISGEELNIREGVVIASHDLTRNNYDPKVGAKILKSISPDYLLRKNGTEYN